MATKKGRSRARATGGEDTTRTSSPVDEMLLAALERGDDSFETGRFLVTFKEGAAEEGLQFLGAQGMRVADARDFEEQAVALESVGDADAVMFPEIGVALLGGAAARERSMSVQEESAADSTIESIDPEYFMFVQGTPGEFLRTLAEEAESRPSEYLRGFLRAAETIARDLREPGQAQLEVQEEAQVLGATWGLNACRVPPSTRSGAGIRVAVLDTGVDLGHPDFSGRLPVSQTQSFVGQPVQDLNGHGTHVTGTSTGPKAPAGSTARYGIGHRTSIFVGKVLTNSGSGTMAGVLNGMNWAIANRCQVINMSLGAQIGVQPAYTNAGQAALNNGLLIIAAAGNAASSTGAPANSPTIMSVASLDTNLRPSSFSNFGKIQIAAPGRDIFSSWPRPTRYKIISGTSMAAPHVTGCASLWAETSPNLRGMALWNRLRSAAKPLPSPASRVGAGLVQAP